MNFLCTIRSRDSMQRKFSFLRMGTSLLSFREIVYFQKALILLNFGENNFCLITYNSIGGAKIFLRERVKFCISTFYMYNLSIMKGQMRQNFKILTFLYNFLNLRLTNREGNCPLPSLRTCQEA